MTDDALALDRWSLPDQLVFLTQGRGSDLPPTMTLVNPDEPYNSSGK